MSQIMDVVVWFKNMISNYEKTLLISLETHRNS